MVNFERFEHINLPKFKKDLLQMYSYTIFALFYSNWCIHYRGRNVAWQLGIIFVIKVTKLSSRYSVIKCNEKNYILIPYPWLNTEIIKNLILLKCSAVQLWYLEQIHCSNWHRLQSFVHRSTPKVRANQSIWSNWNLNHWSQLIIIQYLTNY